MKQLPSIELLESTHTFPSAYIFKVIGKSDDGFLSRVLAKARAANGVETDPPFTVRQTEGGRHVSVTLTVDVPSAARVHDIYKNLSELEGLVLLM
jgi:uncharacterized protein